MGDLLKHDFEKIMESHEPFTFYLHYSTVKGDALGKLILTDCELIFEPLNTKLKGFLSQTEGGFFSNRRLQTSVNYGDISGRVEIFPLAENSSQVGQGFEVAYYLRIGVYHTGY